MAENNKTNLDDLLAEIAGSKPAAAASHLSYVMGVFEKAEAKVDATEESDKDENC